MMRLRLAVLVLASVFAAACATMEPPRIQVQRLGRPQMGLTGATIDVTFNVRNPNDYPVTIDRVRYDLFLNGVRVGDGFITQRVEVGPFGDARMSSRFDLNYLRVPGAVRRIDLAREHADVAADAEQIPGAGNDRSRKRPAPTARRLPTPARRPRRVLPARRSAGAR